MLLLIIGLLVGYYARQVYDKLVEILATIRELKAAEQTGVVRPRATPVPTPPKQEGSVIRSMTPEQYRYMQQRELDRALKGGK